MPSPVPKRISDKGIALVKSFEGYSAKPYFCPAGKPTIGYGHYIQPDERFTTLTTDAAEKLLLSDLAIAEKFVNDNVKVPINQGQFDALVDFAFNLGVGALKNSTLFKRLNEGDYDRAADNFQKWVYAKNVKLPGLVRRRAAEWVLFTSGE